MVASVAVLCPLPAAAERFCYYWVTNDGNAETYEKPPLSLAAPPFFSTRDLGGYLVIGLAQESCRRSELMLNPGRRAAPPPSATSAPVQQDGGDTPTLNNSTGQ